MNKTAIKNFAIWAREKLISEITYKMGLLGITEKGIADSLPQSTNDLQLFDIGTKNYAEVTGVAIKQRSALVSEIKRREKTSNPNTALTSVIEEVAYTWFNRLVAIRFMEVNDYLPSGVRVLSSENPAKSEPDFVTTPFDTDLEFTSFEQDRIIQLKDENKLDELFRMLFIKQCNKLHDILPELFERTDDYTELLLTISFTDKDGVVYHLTHDIPESNFNVEQEGQVEIIGWMYQYYISEKHNQVVNIYKGTVKKEDIPAATQLFTTDWVVRYMVDNSLGRYWIERNPQSKLAERLDFFVTPKNGKIKYIDEKILPTDLTFFDPCMGSGHILVYAFDVLMEIYRECGYSDRDAALNIVQYNLYGMDIDKRAYQLAYFAVMMKARSYNRRALTQGIFNNLAVCEESNAIDRFSYNGITVDKEQNKIGEYLIEIFKNAQELGTLQTLKPANYKLFSEYLLNIQDKAEIPDIFAMNWYNTVLPKMLQFTKQAQIMSRKYAVVCTNPPYMNKLEGQLKKFVVDNYKPYSGDLFSVFMYRNFDYCKVGGYSAFMTPNVWMFIKSYENLRNYILNHKSIISLIQMAKGAFFKEATVDIASFILKNSKCDEKGLYFRLEDFKGDMEVQKQKVLEALADKDCGYFYEADRSNFSKIPGSPVAYWVSENVMKVFDAPTFAGRFISGGRNKTHNNDIYVRQWWEISIFGKWKPYSNGGKYRKWYGNNIDVIDWSENAREFYASHGGLLKEDFWNIEAITWNDITSGNSSYRVKPVESKYSSVSPTLVSTDRKFDYTMLAFLNSVVSVWFNHITNPTLHTLIGNVLEFPDMIMQTNEDKNSMECVKISKTDWDSYETSWDFKRNPLV